MPQNTSMMKYGNMKAPEGNKKAFLTVWKDILTHMARAVEGTSKVHHVTVLRKFPKNGPQVYISWLQRDTNDG